MKVKCFKEASLKGSNGAFVSWCKTSERFQEGIPLRPFGSVSVETIQETSEILMFANINGRIPQFASSCHQWYLAVTSCPGKGIVGSACPAVQLITEAPLYKNGPLASKTGLVDPL